MLRIKKGSGHVKWSSRNMENQKMKMIEMSTRNNEIFDNT